MVRKIYPFVLFFVFCVLPLQAEIKISKNPISIKKELVTKQRIATPIHAVPASKIHRSLILPKGLLEGDAILEYRNLPNGTGLNFISQAKKTYFDKWMFQLTMSAFPQESEGFQFGGFLPGFLYQALPEDEKNPQVAVGLELGLFGKGPLSLSKDNTFSIFPQVHVKKRLSDMFALMGHLKPGIGNNNSGLASLSTTGIWRLTQELDAQLRLDLENLGYDIDSIISLTPHIQYHLKRNIDVTAGVHVGLLGSNLLGNNLFAGLSKRF